VCCELLYKAIECRAEARMLHARARTQVATPGACVPP